MKWKEWREFARMKPSGETTKKRLVKAEYIRDYVLRLWFEDDLDVSIYE
jgi:hypothetical protein